MSCSKLLEDFSKLTDNKIITGDALNLIKEHKIMHIFYFMFKYKKVNKNIFYIYFLKKYILYI